LRYNAMRYEQILAFPVEHVKEKKWITWRDIPAATGRNLVPE
jgi:hypothetical protein